MTDSPEKEKPSTPAQQRQTLLEQQLRANLQRRKAQARARRDGPEMPKGTADEQGGG